MEDLVGKTFGSLIVLRLDRERIQSIPKRRKRYWICRCVCGKEISVPTCNLNGGNSKSCGCVISEKRRENQFHLPPGESALNILYSSYKDSAKRRGILFSLNKDTFREITSSDCFYCGAEPNQVAKSKSVMPDYLHNGIDRIDSSVGYEGGNVVPCCKDCNYAKHEMSKEEFRSWLIRVYNNFILSEKN